MMLMVGSSILWMAWRIQRITRVSLGLLRLELPDDFQGVVFRRGFEGALLV